MISRYEQVEIQAGGFSPPARPHKMQQFVRLAPPTKQSRQGIPGMNLLAQPARHAVPTLTDRAMVLPGVRPEKAGFYRSGRA